jgi:hypothetical protein
MTPAMATTLLRYVMSDNCYRDVYDLPLFYCRDGGRRAIGLRNESDVLYLGSQEVMDLFDDIPGKFIDLKVLSPDVHAQLERDIGTISKVLALERFGIEAFQAYATTRVSWHPSTEELELPIDDFDIEYSWLEKLWKWLNKYETERVAEVVEDLFLIPLQDGTVRKVRNRIKELKSIDCSSVVAYTNATRIRGRLVEGNPWSHRAFPLVKDDFTFPTHRFLLNEKHIAPGSDIGVLLHWITPSIVATLPNECRESLARHILACIGISLPENQKTSVLKLPIFPELKSGESHQGPMLT